MNPTSITTWLKAQGYLEVFEDKDTNEKKQFRPKKGVQLEYVQRKEKGLSAERI